MNYLTLDFETYYDREFSLSKMTTQEYIMSPAFEVLMCGLKWNDGDTFVIDADGLPEYFAKIDWQSTAVVCHNTAFDAAILSWRYGVRPAFLFDTMSMAQSSGMQTLVGSASLDRSVRFLIAGGVQLPEKGNEVVAALGKRRADFTPVEWEAYRGYCAKDVHLTWELFKVLHAYLPEAELVYQDMMLRCFTEPMMRIDRPTVDYELARVQVLKAEALNHACTILNTSPDMLAATLRSNDKFATLLRSLGGITEDELLEGKSGSFVIPTKVSQTTGKTTYAFGKTDEAFVELCGHDDPVVQAVCQARLSAKSSIDETRCQLFQRISDTGFLGIRYKVSGAHTHRLGGVDGNYQNLPSGRKKGQSDMLRRSLLAQDGYVCVNYDASQIEVRVNACLANQYDLLGVFKSGGDPYSFMASDIYGIPAEQIYHGAKKLKDPAADLQRQTGKVAVLGLGFGMGAAKLQTTAMTQYGIHLTTDQAKHITKVYRNKMHRIVNFWKECDSVLAILADGGRMYFGGPDGQTFLADGNRVLFGHRVPGIRLPDGMWLNYPNMRRELKDGKVNFCFDRMGHTGKPVTAWIFSGKLVENLVQATAFAVMKWQAIRINAKYPIKLNTHDEWVCVVPRAQAEECAEYMMQLMRTAPDWLPELPLDTEGGWAQSYGAVDDKWYDCHDNPDRVYRFNPPLN